jgi:sterol desaturase/sphingolipid hydroxylase (fatty acid hydroxylase superfamily)
MRAVKNAPDLLAWKSAAVMLWLALLFAAERLAPATVRPETVKWRRIGRNLALWAVNTALSPFVVVPLSLWAAAHPLWARPDWWSGAGGLLLDLAILDGLIYWWHRANHEVALLWRFHEVHHLDRFLDTSTALRFHFGEVLLSALFRSAVIVALAVPFSSVLAFEAMVLAAALFHHSNVRLPGAVERALSLVVVTPSIHWVHHHRVRSDTDANYSTILSLWDRLFTSRSPTPRRPGMEIGTEGREEEAIAGLLAHPFRRDAGARPRLTSPTRSPSAGASGWRR